MASDYFCPRCDHRLSGVPSSGGLDLVCAACGQRSALSRGRLVRLTTPATDRALGPAPPASGSARRWALVAGATTTATIAFVLGAMQGDLVLAVVAAGMGGLAIGFVLLHRLHPIAHVRYYSSDTRQAFATAERLRAARRTFSVARNGHARSMRERQELRERLVALRDRMRALGISAYEPRIAGIERGLVTIDRQLALDRALCDGYDRNIRMVDIELDAGATGERMNDDISAELESKMQELHALEQSRRELELQLEASVEVEQVLLARGGRRR